MTSLSDLTVDELSDGICLRAGRIAAAHAELTAWIAEFDRREGWGGPGMTSCAQWLTWRIGLSPGAAREQVRVARRLDELPEIAAAFGEGRISYSKVRAITRVAQVADGADWVELARHSSAAQLEQIARAVRRAQAVDEAKADPELAQWKVRTRKRYDRDGNLVITITTRPEYAPVIEAGLDAKRAELQRQLDAGTDCGDREHGSTDGDPRSQAARAALDAGQLALDVPAEPPSALSTRPADEVDLDEQAPGWPAGTTRRQARQERAAFTARWRGSAPSDATEQALKDAWVATTTGVPAETSDRAPAHRVGGDPGAGAAGSAAPVPPEPPSRPAVTDGDALLALAQEALAAERRDHPDVARRRRAQLTAQIDPLSGWGRQADGEILPPSTLRSVMKTLPGRGGNPRLLPLTALDLRRHDLGRTSRDANAKLRELLGTLDGERCRFPGCTRRHKLHAHHIRFWSVGGRTDLDNLVLVCARHHTLIHSQGFQLTLRPDRRLEVRTADGVPVLHHPAQPWGDPDDLARGCGQDVSAETLPPDHCDNRIDLDYIVAVVLAQAA
jgi:hypothetical protein